MSFNREAKRIENSFTSGFYRDPRKEGLRFEVKGGYAVKTSLIHPLWSCVGGIQDYRPSAEIKKLVESGEKVFLPIAVKHQNWNHCNYQTLNFLPDDRVLQKRQDRIKRIKEAQSRFPSLPQHKQAKIAKTTAHSFLSHKGMMDDDYKISITLDEDVAYLLGLLIGDGCMTKIMVDHGRIGFSSNDNELTDFVTRILTFKFGSSLKHTEGCDYHTSCSKLRGLVKHLKINCYAHEKEIPREIIESPKSVVRAFLQGLFDTDGTSDKFGRVSYCSSSRKLAEDVHQLLLAFGVKASIRWKPNKCRGAWLVDLFSGSHDFYREVGFKLSRKSQRQSLLPKSQYDGHNLYPVSANQMPDIDRKMWSMNGQVFWRQIRKVEDAKVDLYDVTVPGNHSFIGNGFINHNTWSVLARIWRHLWETPGARVAVIAKSKSLAKGGGSWEQLTTTVAQEWCESGMVGETGMPIAYTTTNGEGVPGPKQDSSTRTPFFKIRNYYGGESECMLLSVDHDKEVGDKLKGKYFSMVYFMELSMFDDPRILSTSLQCLRLSHLKTQGEDNPWFQWIADTNPHEDLGNRHWIYDVFYKERNKEHWSDDPDSVKREEEDRKSRIYYSKMEVIELFYWENPFLSEEETIELERSCGGDPGLHDSWVLGKWGDAGKKRNRLFASVFIRESHVVGEQKGEVDQIDVNPMSNHLLGGWDIGGVNNHAAVLLDRWPIMVGNTELSGFSVLDELVYIKEELRISQYGHEMLQKIEALEAKTGKKFEWTHWADDTALNTFRPTSGTFDWMEIRIGSGGRINLTGVVKPDGSKRARIRLLRQLIWQNRLYVSARCTHVIRLIEEAKAGDDPDKDPFDESTGMKHIFDALTYPLFMECIWELEQAAEPPRASSPVSSGSFAIAL